MYGSAFILALASQLPSKLHATRTQCGPAFTFVKVIHIQTVVVQRVRTVQNRVHDTTHIFMKK